MLKRSVNTYMNAWTGEDFTCYPFSSSNPKDWNNLLNVYTDMSFKPLLNELDFMQEGWRYEINEKGQKEIKGIVFNEMKGAYQSA
jgi:Zn-dependent M16 (insulinase) family peptidase